MVIFFLCYLCFIIINYFTRMRYLDTTGRLQFHYKGEIAQAPEGYLPWFVIPRKLSTNIKVIFGHWSALQGKASISNIFPLDTGCCWGRWPASTNTAWPIRCSCRQLFRCSTCCRWRCGSKCWHRSWHRPPSRGHWRFHRLRRWKSDRSEFKEHQAIQKTVGGGGKINI